MEQERSVSGTIRTLSNLLRRKAMEKVPQPPEGDIYSQMGGWVMAFLHQREGEEVFQRDVEQRFCIRRSTASRTLKHLEDQGLVQRLPVERDARLKRLVLTDKAQAIHQQIQRGIRDTEEQLTAGMTAREVEQFLALAAKLRANLTAGSAPGREEPQGGTSEKGD